MNFSLSFLTPATQRELYPQFIEVLPFLDDRSLLTLTFQVCKKWSQIVVAIKSDVHQMLLKHTILRVNQLGGSLQFPTLKQITAMPSTELHRIWSCNLATLMGLVSTATDIPDFGLSGTSSRALDRVIQSKTGDIFFAGREGDRKGWKEFPTNSENPILVLADLMALTSKALHYLYEGEGLFVFNKPIPTIVRNHSDECKACRCHQFRSLELDNVTQQKILRLPHRETLFSPRYAEGVHKLSPRNFEVIFCGTIRFTNYSDAARNMQNFDYEKELLIRRIKIQEHLLQAFERLGILKSSPAGLRSRGVKLLAQIDSYVSPEYWNGSDYAVREAPPQPKPDWTYNREAPDID